MTLTFTEEQLRKVSPTARKVARLTGELESITARLREQIVFLDDGSKPTKDGIRQITGYERVAYGEKQIIGDLSSVAKRLRNLISDLKVLDARSDGMVEVRRTLNGWEDGRLRDEEECAADELDTLQTFVEGAATYPADRPLGSKKVIA